MAAPHSIDVVELLEQHLQGASPDLLRQVIASFANAMMSAQADQVSGTAYSERSDKRVNRRIRLPGPGVGHPCCTVELAVPKLCEGSWVAAPTPPAGVAVSVTSAPARPARRRRSGCMAFTDRQ